MQFLTMRTVSFLVLTILVLASCSGGSQQTNPTVQPQAIPHTQTLPLSRTYTLQPAGGFSGTIALHISSALPDSTVAFHSERSAMQNRVHAQGSPPACPTIPTIQIRNPFSFPITIDIDGFTVQLPCNVNGQLFGVTFFQVKPQPQTVSPTKLGDVTAQGSTITFSPNVKQLVIPAMTTSALSILAEASTADVAFPVAPGSTTVLTANAPELPSSLSFTYSTAKGGSLYSAGCFNAHDNTGALVPALQGIPLVGTPSFYCQINSQNSAITFGQIVQFAIGAPKPDAAVIQLDGPTQAYLCPGAPVKCNTASFTVPTFQTFIAANVQALRLCVPLQEDTDCNNVNNNPSPPPSTQNAKAGRDFQLLVADDPTYKPGTPAAPVPWSGLFRMKLTGPCHLSTAPDNDNGDVPPGYSDDKQNGVGPYAEFDVTPTGTGTCSITAAEGLKYITDDSNSANPVPRSATIQITIGW